MLYKDCCQILSEYLLKTTPAPQTRLQKSHTIPANETGPLVFLLKETFMPLLQLAFWNYSLSIPISHTLQKVASLVTQLESEANPIISVRLLGHIGTFTDIVVHILQSRTSNQIELESLSEQEAATSVRLLKREESALVKWCLSLGSDQRVLVQNFLLPLLAQLATHSDNWNACSEAIIGVYNGRLTMEQIPVAGKSFDDLNEKFILKHGNRRRLGQSLKHSKASYFVVNNSFPRIRGRYNFQCSNPLNQQLGDIEFAPVLH
jgi:hypothetical protein